MANKDRQAICILDNYFILEIAHRLLILAIAHRLLILAIAHRLLLLAIAHRLLILAIASPSYLGDRASPFNLVVRTHLHARSYNSDLSSLGMLGDPVYRLRT